MNRVLAIALVLALAPIGGAGAQEAIPTAQNAAADAPAPPAGAAVSTIKDERNHFDDRGPRPMIGPCGPTGPNKAGDGPDHNAHGEVTVGAGSHGYREAGGVVCQPLGDNSSLTIAVDAGQIHGRRGW